MLEVRHLSKIYKAKQKNGTDTYALNDVSLQFPEKGMVFLLGKSGSGKSTLLNVCGGLDAPTSGEIIVKGRSSKTFIQSDFDSYRNTFVGFIFQEYNILNEFTVEDNIALALELQGKPKDKKVIADLLEQVDLTGFAKRKPNTLSGGQKQRIAIARALIKSPEIIMADEPTGALDSATGKQVFDTLKKLSMDKLVIVVSHDREFAELYADRIIELKDGKIISDVTKTHEVQKALSNNVTAIGDILCIKQGNELTDADFDRIKSIIKNSSGDVIITGSEPDVQNFKKINRITDNGEKEVFKDTDESKTEVKTYTPEQSKFIRSKFPARHAAKMGISGLKSKPVRLFFTVVLCVVSFVLFGILSTLMLYNHEGMFKETLKNSDQNFVVFDKIYHIKNSYYENGVLSHTYNDSAQAKFSSADVEKINKTFGSGSFGAIDVRAHVTVRESSSSYWSSEFSSAAYMDENAFLRQGLVGTYPEESNEIAISTYFAEMLAECKTVDEKGSVIELTSPEDIIGKNILMDGQKYKVTAIFDSGELDPKFDALKDGADQNYSLEMELASALSDGTHLLLALSEKGFENFNKLYGDMYGYHYDSDSHRVGNYYVEDTGSSDDQDGESAPYRSDVLYKHFQTLDSADFVSVGNKGTALSDNQAIVSFKILWDALRGKIYTITDELYDKYTVLYNFNFQDQMNNFESEIERYSQYLDEENTRIQEIDQELGSLPPESPDRDMLYDERNIRERNKEEYENYIQNFEEEKVLLIEKLYEEFGLAPEEVDETLLEYEKTRDEFYVLIDTLDIIANGEQHLVDEDDEPFVKTFTQEERETLLREFVAEYAELISDMKFNFYLVAEDRQTPLNEETGYDIAGIIIPTNGPDDYVQEEVYFNDKMANELWNIQKKVINYTDPETKYKDQDDAVFTRLYVPFDHSNGQIDYLWTVANTEGYAEDDSKIGLTGSYISNLEMINSFVTEFSEIFLYVGLVLAVFAVLLFSNFISVSISQKRREIGILRAVGARSIDVFKIFFSESLTIAAICSVLSSIGSSLLCQVLNTEMGSAIGASIFVFGIASILIIVAIALLTAILATFLPVWNAAKKKPVDSIKAI